MGGRPTVALIDRAALKHNYNEIRQKVSPQTAVMSVVKANAYGHGYLEVSRTLEQIGSPLFGVVMVEEGVILRGGGITRPIVVMGGIFADQIGELFEYDLTPVVFDVETAALINDYAAKTGAKKNVHVKIDTGMGRLGLLPKQIITFLQAFKGMEMLNMAGLMSHFAEVEDKKYSQKQLDLFIKSVGIIQGMGFAPTYFHMANSAGIVDFVESHFNIIRPGIMLYGSYPSARFKRSIELMPVMKLCTRIEHIKKVPVGFSISYGRTFVTKQESLIATIPIGYGDGLPRRLSSRVGAGEVLIRGKRVPIVGTVCMDLTMCDVTDVEGAATGDEAVIIGAQGDDFITAEEIAERAGTIPYEILCNISARVPRVLV